MSGPAHEMDANAEAVEVIQVWGYSEQEAVVMSWLEDYFAAAMHGV